MTTAPRLYNGESLALDRVREVLEYHPDTGHFTWRKRLSPSGGPGDIAGVKNTRGYILLSIDNVRVYAHRVAWFYVNGEWPKDQIDHINGERADNRWCNLREASSSENACNGRLRPSNKSGYTGVSWEKAKKRWVARAVKNGKQYVIGRFMTKEEANDARVAFVAKLYGDFAPSSDSNPEKR